MTLPAHVRTWQFQPSVLVPEAASAEAGNDALAIALVNSFLGRGSWVDKDNGAVASAGNWTVWGSCDGAGNFGNGDAVNRWDTAGVLDPAKIVHAAAASNHSWMVLQQTGLSATFQVCIDFSNASSGSATIVVAFGAGFGTAAGGADGTATARPTAAAANQQILISNTSWGGGDAVGTVYHAMKSSDGKAFRFLAQRSDANIIFYNFEAPDPVVSGWTNPAIAHAIGHSTTTEQVTYTRLVGANFYGQTAGGTIFASSLIHDGSISDTNIPQNQGFPTELGNTNTFREVGLYSATVNARYVNGKVVDAFWANENATTAVGSYNGQVAPAGGPVQWCRFGALWLPYPSGVNPRTSQ